MFTERESGLYGLMARLPVKTGYAGKIFLAAFLPAQIPVVALFLLVHFHVNEDVKIGGLVASMILAAFLMAYAIYSLLNPMRMARIKLHQFVEERHVDEENPGPAQGYAYADSAEVLVAEVEKVVAYADHSIRLLEQASSTDPLTGVSNRRFCGPRLEQDLARSQRDGVPVTLAFFDLDCLKQINDEHGHLAGDHCLSHLVKTISLAVRDGDWIARWGGDEFVLCLWSADRAQAQLVCSRILQALREAPALYEGQQIPISASVGICQAKQNEDATSLLNKADTALLKAKKSGRDRLAQFEPQSSNTVVL